MRQSRASAKASTAIRSCNERGRGYFSPAGREKLHGLGALDMALWDIKGKSLGVAVHQLLGGFTRDYVECYSTGYPSQGSVEARFEGLHEGRLSRV